MQACADGWRLYHRPETVHVAAARPMAGMKRCHSPCPASVWRRSLTMGCLLMRLHHAPAISVGCSNRYHHLSAVAASLLAPAIWVDWHAELAPCAQHRVSAGWQTDAPDFHVLRTTIIELVMATDMKNHFALVSRLQARLTTVCYLHISRAASTFTGTLTHSLTPACNLLADDSGLTECQGFSSAP